MFSAPRLWIALFGRARPLCDQRIVELLDPPDAPVAEPVDTDVGVRVWATGGQDFTVAHVLENELVGIDALVHRGDLEAHAKHLARFREIRSQCVLALDPPRWI